MKEVLLAALPIAGSALLALTNWSGRRPLIRSGSEIQRETLTKELTFASQFPEGSVERRMLDEHLRVGVSRYIADSMWQTRDRAYNLNFAHLLVTFAMAAVVISWVMSLVLLFARHEMRTKTADALDDTRIAVVAASWLLLAAAAGLVYLTHRSRKKEPSWPSVLDDQTWELLEAELAPDRRQSESESGLRRSPQP